MSEAERIANEILAEPPLLYARVLVELHRHPASSLVPDDSVALTKLRVKGCVSSKSVTAFGAQVAEILERRGFPPLTASND